MSYEEKITGEFGRNCSGIVCADQMVVANLQVGGGESAVWSCKVVGDTGRCC